MLIPWNGQWRWARFDSHIHNIVALCNYIKYVRIIWPNPASDCKPQNRELMHPVAGVVLMVIFREPNRTQPKQPRGNRRRWAANCTIRLSLSLLVRTPEM